MLAVAPVGKKEKIQTNLASSNGQPGDATTVLNSETNNDDFATMTDNNFQIQHQIQMTDPSSYPPPNRSQSLGRQDPRNIVGDVYIGDRLENKAAKAR